MSPPVLKKLVEHPEWDAVILAKAGLERLGLYAPETVVQGRKLYMRPLPVEAFIPLLWGRESSAWNAVPDRKTKELLADQRCGNLRLRRGGTHLPGAPGRQLLHPSGRVRLPGRG